MPHMRDKHPKTIKNKGKIKQADSLNLKTNPPVVSHKSFFQSVYGVSLRIFRMKKSFQVKTLWHRKTLLQRKTVLASMTVEASLVLPLFLLFFLTLSGGLEILRFQSRLDEALWKLGRETCVYGTILKAGQDGKNLDQEEGKTALSLAGNLAFDYGYVKGRLKALLGEEYLAEAPIFGGIDGMQFWQGSIANPDDTVRIYVNYKAEPRYSLPGFRKLRMEDHYFGRLWTGYELKETGNELYYLAENAEVYHKDAQCTHLKLSPYQVSKRSLEASVNEKGCHYRACSYCAVGAMPSELWISPEGDCYHYTRDCSGLKRTVRAVTWDIAKEYRPCSRCGN